MPRKKKTEVVTKIEPPAPVQTRRERLEALGYTSREAELLESKPMESVARTAKIRPKYYEVTVRSLAQNKRYTYLISSDSKSNAEYRAEMRANTEPETEKDGPWKATFSMAVDR